jgi:imidazolonepropionase
VTPDHPPRPADLLVHGIGQLLTMAGGDGPRTGAGLADIGLVEDAAVVVRDGRVSWAGPERDLASHLTSPLAGSEPQHVVDAGGRVVMPAFVDCHTHIPFAGGRESEYEMRNAGRSYLDILRSGGGILNSAKHFRAMPTDELVSLNRDRLRRMLAEGTVTVECKSGYALDLQHELRALEVMRTLDGEGPWKLVPTFLGAHAVPDEFASNREGYVDLLINEMIPRIAERGLAVYCDVFIEKGAFTVEEGRRILTAARARGLVPKLHVDEFTSLGGTALAAEVRAISADHLEAITAEDTVAIAEAGVIGVLMPGVNYFLGNHAYAPARSLIEAGVAVAIATDFNPGSCMCHSMFMILSLATSQSKLTAEEALVAATRNAAYACGRGDRVGRIQIGFDADLLVLDLDDYRGAAYHFGSSHVETVVADGRVITG